MKIETNKNQQKRFTVFDFQDGETFTYPDRDDDAVFIRVGNNNKLIYGYYDKIKITAICLKDGHAHCFDKYHEIIPCDAKVVVE